LSHFGISKSSMFALNQVPFILTSLCFVNISEAYLDLDVLRIVSQFLDWQAEPEGASLA
jgi:hypothetical protein